MFFTNPEYTKFFHEVFHFLEGCKVFFFAVISTKLLISLENFYLIEKQNNNFFAIKNRRFVDSGIVKTCDELDL